MHVIYQVLPRLWGNGKISSWDDAAFDHLKSLSVTDIWFTGIPRHSSWKDYVKGTVGSPYCVENWFDVNPYLADNPERRIEEFRDLVARAHRKGFKVFTDLIPNHASPDCRDLPLLQFHDYDWTDTRKVDWSNPLACDRFVDIVSFWAELGVDGMRCDMVELVPADALRELFSRVREKYPSFIFIAEAYDRSNYVKFINETGFDLLYDKSGFYDIARSVITSGESARAFTRNWQSLGLLQERMLNFLENHDEQRFASDCFAGDVSRSYAAIALGSLFNGASWMIYAGGETGEKAQEAADGRTSIFDIVEVGSLKQLDAFIHGQAALSPWEEASLERQREILSHTKKEPFRSGRIHDLCYCNELSPGFNPDRHFAFLRYDSSHASLVLCNFSDAAADVLVRIPENIAGTPQGLPLEVKIKAAPWDAAILDLQL